MILFLTYYFNSTKLFAILSFYSDIQPRYTDLLTKSCQRIHIAVFQENMSLEFITGYLVEYSLSADNVFVFILIFNSFGVQKRYYKKILVWGVLGAIILRLIFIFLGAALLQRFDWIIYVFGAFLVYTGIKILISHEEEEEMNPGEHPIVKFLSKYFNVYKRNVIGRFFIRTKKGKVFMTPIFVIVVVIAFTDILLDRKSVV